MKMKQMILVTGTGFELHARATRKADFLARMESLLPWAELCALIEPHYQKAGNGCLSIGLKRMLRMYWVDSGLIWPMKLARTPGTTPWYSGRSSALTWGGHPGCHDLAEVPAPVRRERLRQRDVHPVRGIATGQWRQVSGGAMMDVTLMSAPPSTKNKDKADVNLVGLFRISLKNYTPVFDECLPLQAGCTLPPQKSIVLPP